MVDEQQHTISVVLPTYRRPRLLRRAIESVLAQTYRNFLIFVYDNASGDETGEVTKEYVSRDSRVEYHCHPVNIGLVNNFIGGIKRVRTPWFICLSDDDLLLPRFFETALVALQQHQEAMMFLGATIFAAPDARVLDVISPSSGNEFYAPPEGFLRTLRQRFGWTSAVLNRAAVQSIGGVESNVGEFLDFYLMLKVASRYPVVLSETPCGVFFDGGAQTSVKINSWHKGLLRTRESIEADHGLPAAFKRVFLAAMSDLIERSIFNWGVSKMARFQRFDDAEEAIEILRKGNARLSRIRVVELVCSQSVLGAVARQTFRLGYQFRSQTRHLVLRRVRKACDSLLRDALRNLPSASELRTNEMLFPQETLRECAKDSQAKRMMG
jgi:glycosyltransferase involved in cell wall biosynthesis